MLIKSHLINFCILSNQRKVDACQLFLYKCMESWASITLNVLCFSQLTMFIRPSADSDSDTLSYLALFCPKSELVLSSYTVLLKILQVLLPAKQQRLMMRQLTPLLATSLAQMLLMCSWALVSHGPWLPSIGKLRVNLSKSALEAWVSLLPFSVLRPYLQSSSWCWDVTPLWVANWAAPRVSKLWLPVFLSSSGSSMSSFLPWKPTKSLLLDSKMDLDYWIHL